jgi:tetratricopeptide (TPR) repeat protein
LAKSPVVPGFDTEKRQHEIYSLLDRVIGLQADNHMAWNQMAEVAAKNGDIKRAVRAFLKLRAIEPKRVEHVLNLARVHAQAGDAESAEQVLQNGLKEFPDDDEVRLSLGRIRFRLGKTDSAVKILRQIEVCPKKQTADGGSGKKPACPTTAHYLAQDELGANAVRRGDLKSARAIYNRLVDMYPGDFMAWEVLAALDEYEKNWAAAEEKYRKSLAIDRSHFSGWRGLGRAQLNQNKLKDARYAYRKADELLAENPQAAIQMADELLRLGDRSWALSLLQRARILLGGDQAQLKKIDSKTAALKQKQDAAPDLESNNHEKQDSNGNH